MVMFWCIFFIMVIAIIVIVADFNDCGSCMSGAVAGIIITVLLGIAIEEKNPSVTPIDVYRGKTTLEITYRDSVAVDSVVVWRNNNGY